MRTKFTDAGRSCLALILTLSASLLTAGVSVTDAQGALTLNADKTRVSEYVANDAGCGAHNILTVRALLNGSGAVTLGGSATPGRDYTLLNPEFHLDNDEKNYHDLLFHVFDDAVLEGDETIILTFPDGATHTITITDNETSVIVGNGRPVASSSWPFFRWSTPITTASVAAEATLGPLETVYFMTRDGNGVLGKISNLSRHDFGCVTVESLPLEVAATPGFEGCMPRMFSVTPSNTSPNASYQVTWYLTDEELSEYSSAKAPAESEISIFNDAGPESTRHVTSAPAEVAWVTGGKALTATFKGSFGKFGVGFKAVQSKLYGFNQEQYLGAQLRPVAPAKHKLRSSSQKKLGSKAAGQKVAGQ